MTSLGLTKWQGFGTAGHLCTWKAVLARVCHRQRYGPESNTSLDRYFCGTGPWVFDTAPYGHHQTDVCPGIGSQAGEFHQDDVSRPEQTKHGWVLVEYHMLGALRKRWGPWKKIEKSYTNLSGKSIWTSRSCCAATANSFHFARRDVLALYSSWFCSTRSFFSICSLYLRVMDQWHWLLQKGKR